MTAPPFAMQAYLLPLALLLNTIHAFTGSVTFNNYLNQVGSGHDVACDAYKAPPTGTGLPSESNGIYHAAVNDYAPNFPLSPCFYQGPDALLANGQATLQASTAANWYVPLISVEATYFLDIISAHDATSSSIPSTFPPTLSSTLIHSPTLTLHKQQRSRRTVRRA